MEVLKVFNAYLRRLLPDDIVDEAVREVNTDRLAKISKSVDLQREYLHNLVDYKKDMMILARQFSRGNVTRHEVCEQLATIYIISMPLTTLA